MVHPRRLPRRCLAGSVWWWFGPAPFGPCRPLGPRRWGHDGRPHHRLSEALAGHAGDQGRRATWCRRYASRALRAAAVRAVGLKSAAGLFGSPREDRKHFRGRAPDGAGAGLGAARRIRPASTSPLELRPAPDPRGHIYDPPARLQRGLSPPSGRSPTSCPKSEIIAHRARRRSSPRVHGRRLCTGDHWAATGPGIGARGAGPGDLVPRCCQSFRPPKAARARAQRAELRDTTAFPPWSRQATYVISVVQLRAEPQNGVGPEA